MFKAIPGGRSTLADLTKNADTWEELLHKIRTGQMPPAGRPQPADVTPVAIIQNRVMRRATSVGVMPARQ